MMTDKNLNFKITAEAHAFLAEAFIKNEKVCECRINVEENIWSVSSWYTKKEFLNQGYGFATMKYLILFLEKHKCLPDKIQYIWNGSNKYVLDWMVKHFDAENICPVAVQKYASDDDWESHIYVLDKNKFFDYFKTK